MPGTAGNDGESLDALVLADDPTDPGTIVRVRPVGVFWLKTDAGPEAKVISVPDGDPVWVELEEIDHVPSHLKAEIENFFEVYKLLEPGPRPSRGLRGQGRGGEGHSRGPSSVRGAVKRFPAGIQPA